MNDLNLQFQTALKTPGSNVLEEFMMLNGRYSNFVKETFFIRCACGSRYDEDAARLQAWIAQGGAQKGGCVFEPVWKSQPSAQDVSRYIALYQDGCVKFPFHFENLMWQRALESGFDELLRLFKQVRGRSEEAIVRNFAVKILYWMDLYFPRLFLETTKMNCFPKFACGGSVKLAEYLFLYLLFRLGCDVLYISPTGEVSVDHPVLLKLSQRVEESHAPSAPSRPQPKREQIPERKERIVVSMASIRRPERHAPAPAPAPAPVHTPAPIGNVPRKTRNAPSASRGTDRQPLEFEELAKCAASVVMIRVFDQNNQCFKSGSGVIVSDKGYILTNLHVVNGGRYYGILLEEETDVFYTNELIKYHQDYDLAVLRMEKRRTPIPVSQCSGLVRGQKVVAIGSPLGLFNSVSDGIISGFRELEKVSMIQFTAPVSHGSSGGALLDLYGDLIGLITGGFDDGQNLNLAVGYQTIYPFIRGLL